MLQASSFEIHRTNNLSQQHPLSRFSPCQTLLLPQRGDGVAPHLPGAAPFVLPEQPSPKSSLQRFSSAPKSSSRLKYCQESEPLLGQYVHHAEEKSRQTAAFCPYCAANLQQNPPRPSHTPGSYPAGYSLPPQSVAMPSDIMALQNITHRLVRLTYVVAAEVIIMLIIFILTFIP